MKTKLMNILAAGILPMALCNCTTTVADHVPMARGTATGEIKVDPLTQVSTFSRIVPGSVAPTCAPGRNAVLAAPPWATSNEGIAIATNRLAPVEGYNHVASGTGNLLQGGGVLTFGIGAARGKLRSQTNVHSSSTSTSGVNLGGCTDPTSPYIYGN
jgi:hypothetical protein